MSSNRLLILLIIVIILLFGGILFVSLNRQQTESPPPTTAFTQVPTIWVTQLVTQIIATVPSPTASQIPTSTAFPTATLVWDPWSVPLYYPLPDCSASRLREGDMAFVGYLDRTLRIALSNQIFVDPGIRDLVMGEYLQITSEPVCEQNHVIWQVRAISDNTIGYVPEGNGDIYWLFPASPSIPTPRRIRP